MKFIIGLFTLSIFVFAEQFSYIDRALLRKNMQRNDEIFRIEQERHKIEMEEYYRRYPEKRPLSAAEKRAKKIQAHKKKIIEANQKAKKKNLARQQEWDRTHGLTYKSKYTNKQSIVTERKKVNLDKYRDSAQLIIAGEHLYRVTEAKVFKKTKILVKSLHGTFAFPAELFDSAEKINFDSVVR